MLPNALLITRSRSGKIKPVYVPLEESYIDLASRLIETYEAHVHKRKGGLADQCQRLEELGFDYRLVRGLVALLDRSSSFEPHARVNPKIARREVFLAANKCPLVSTDAKRQKVVVQAASALDVSPIQLEESLWSDYDEELMLEHFAPPQPRELVQRYNLSLTQTLLFRAASLEFVVKSHYQRIFSRLKHLGLMYMVERINGTFRVIVNGPTSLFKLTERYGTSLAKLLPIIVEAGEWSLSANIVSRERQTPKLLEFRLNSKSAKDIFPASAREMSEQFDSSVEAAFASSFKALRLGWTLKREPELLLAGRNVFIPDFSFEKGHLKVYLEVVGFWTDKYLKKKIAKLQELNVENLLIAVDRSLSCSSFEKVRGFVIFFDKKVPVKPIVDHLKQMEKSAISQQVDIIDGSKLLFKGDLVDIAQIADKQSVSTEALRRWLKTNPPACYHLIGSQLISDSTLAVINEKLQQLDGEAWSLVLQKIEEEGVSSPKALLETLGFIVEWHGLDPNCAIFCKHT